MATAQQARASIDSALQQVEARLGGSPSAEEMQLLQAAYSALWVELAKIDDAILQAAADRVVAASLRLEQIVRSAGSMAPATLRQALTAATAALQGTATSTGGPVITTVTSGTTGTTVQPPPPPPPPPPAMGMSGWSDLITAYRATGQVSGSLKTASLAQWIVESGRGTSILARQHLNFGGIKFRDRMVGHAQPVDYTGSDGETTVYCKFASIDAFILGYWHFIQSGPYEGWDGFQNDGPGYLRHIAAKYAGDSAYLTKVMAVYDEAKSLLGLDGQSSTTTSSSTTGVVSGGGDLKLAVVIGHNSSSKGHAGQSPIEDAEYDWNGRVAAAMAAEAGHYNITMATIRRQAGLGYTAEIAQAYEEVSAFGAHCAIELHYNGVDDASADGIEMLCRPDSAKAKAMGLALVAEVSSLLHLRIRRGDGLYLVNPGDRGAGSCYALSNVPTVLCEPFFVTNAQDRAAAAGAGEAALGRAYLRAVRAWANASS